MKNRYNLIWIVVIILTLSLPAAGWSQPDRKENGFGFEFSFPQYNTESIDGRIILIISTDSTREPRFRVRPGLHCPQVFGMDVEKLDGGKTVFLGPEIFGYPLESIQCISKGEYYIQAVLHKYETFERGDGHTVKLPMDRGEGQRWNRAPGNLYSSPVKKYVDPGKQEPIRIVLDKVIEPLPEYRDTKYVRHVKIVSKKLSAFWGRPMELGAVVLLPEGYDEHPDRRYPLIINHGHFAPTMWFFRDQPPDKQAAGRRLESQKMCYRFYQKWTSGEFPRVILMQVQHANPFYDDSYAVNSVNVGPYGDAITNELIPHIEKRFHCIGEGWARAVYGGSTGGWEALAVQVFYPEAYNGCWAACPDPIDFRSYSIVNIYDDENAYFLKGPWASVLRPGFRNYLGRISYTMQDENHLELVLGEKSRSGGQLDIWQAVFSPVGDDGYPKPIWDKRTGDIDKTVAAYWREHYDLRAILERDWPVLGPILKGKIHIAVGDMDNFYLNNAVYMMEEFLESTDPYYDGEVIYGDRKEHCWGGDYTDPETGKDRLYHGYFVELIAEYLRNTAPKGSDTSWFR